MENETRSCPACNQSVDLETIYCFECGTNVLLADKAQLANITAEIVIDNKLIANYKKLKQSLVDMNGVENIADAQKDHSNQLYRQLTALNTPINTAKQYVIHEKRDVDVLKTLTWTSLKARIKGNKDELLSKEEQEYFAEVAKYQALVDQQEELSKQSDIAKNQWQEAQGLVNKKTAIENEIKNLIKKIGTEIAHPIEDQLEERVRAKTSQLKEIEHEIFVLKNNQSYAKNAFQLYHQASDKLDGAMGMSTWDLMGGGLIVDSMKRSKVGEARRLVKKANSQLDLAIEALKEQMSGSSASVSDTGFWGDSFFDSFWTDMKARDKIRGSQRSVKRAIDRTLTVTGRYQELIYDLEEKLKSTKDEHIVIEAELELERIKLLENYMKK